MSFCHTCNKAYHYLGIARHRSAHLERGEVCVITLQSGTWRYTPPVLRQQNVDAETHDEEAVQ